MVEELPKGYIPWIDRVSNIVSFNFPFEWNSKEQYLKWLEKNNIPEEEYLEEAQIVWTFVHLQLEKYLLLEPLDLTDRLFNLHKKEIEWWLEFLRDLFIKPWKLLSEVVVLDEKQRFQGSIDLIRIDEKTKTVWLYDWKTWGIAKKKWWLNNSPTKNVDKLKKVALQLSLYAEVYRQKGYKIWWIAVLWLHNDWLIEYSLFAKDNLKVKDKSIRLWSSAELNILLWIYKSKKEEEVEEITSLPHAPLYTLNINYKTMQIRVNWPIKWVAYSNSEIILEQWDYMDLPDTARINKAIELQKTLANNYSNNG